MLKYEMEFFLEKRKEVSCVLKNNNKLKIRQHKIFIIF